MYINHNYAMCMLREIIPRGEFSLKTSCKSNIFYMEIDHSHENNDDEEKGREKFLLLHKKLKYKKNVQSLKKK